MELLLQKAKARLTKIKASLIRLINRPAQSEHEFFGYTYRDEKNGKIVVLYDGKEHEFTSRKAAEIWVDAEIRSAKAW